jgi:hypothetical protein
MENKDIEQKIKLTHETGKRTTPAKSKTIYHGSLDNNRTPPKPTQGRYRLSC